MTTSHSDGLVTFLVEVLTGLGIDKGFLPLLLEVTVLFPF